MNDIEKYIKELEKEIGQTEDQSENESQLLRLQELMLEYSGEDKLISSTEIAEMLKTAKPERRLDTGFSCLDEVLGGFRLRQVVVIAAATKSGKTSFCIELTSRFKQEQPLWFPFEEGAPELVQKFLDRGEQPPHFYTPESITGNTLAWIEKKIIEGRAKYDSRVVFIDHLHFIVPFRAERPDLAIGEAMRGLKQLAKRWNVLIFLIAHLKKTKVEVQPDLEELRDSSFIAQEADTVLMLWRQTERKNGQVVITDNVNVSVQANRRTGKTGNVSFLYSNGRFLEQDITHEDTQNEHDSF